MTAKRGRVDDRPGAWHRGYDARWEKAAASFRWRNPHCLGCMSIGLRRKGVVVDHVIPHRGDQRLFWQPHNWQTLCTWHHASIKPELERRYARAQIRAEDLWLSSEVAVRLTREKYRPAVGLDGFAIAGS